MSSGRSLSVIVVFLSAIFVSFVVYILIVLRMYIL
ncbi:unnamed protein product [Thlaspi arvense]|uniref:Uncharacterized protein n=1 Tax=Thlaspi arvense TaxID=13288 RepID=A0AAU9RSS1_THLAR|nr:unnamed protein product [Thlaspi arvense]